MGRAASTLLGTLPIFALSERREAPVRTRL